MVIVTQSVLKQEQLSVLWIHYRFLFHLELNAEDLPYDREQTCVDGCSQPTFLLGLVPGGTLVFFFFFRTLSHDSSQPSDLGLTALFRDGKKLVEIVRM